MAISRLAIVKGDPYLGSTGSTKAVSNPCCCRQVGCGKLKRFFICTPIKRLN